MPKKRRDRLRVELPKLPTLRTSMPRLPIRPRGPKALSIELGPPVVEESNQPPPMPLDFRGTLPEWRVYFWLTKHNIEFDFQSSMMGGRLQLGGLVSDFLLPQRSPPMVLNVQGIFWHYFGPNADRQKDQRQQDQLENMGYQVINLDEDMILERLDYVMRAAMQGIDLSRAKWSR